MVSTVQEVSGVNAALDNLEQRIIAYREFLLRCEGDIERVAITEQEVDIVEAMIRRLAQRITGNDPDAALWESMSAYCSRNNPKAPDNLWKPYRSREYFRWGLLWVQNTRTYLRYLSGMQSAVGDPRVRSVAPSGAEPEPDLPQYDVAFSFAGEDREHARVLAQLITAAHFSVFYDEYEQSTLWGKNLYSHLSDIYQNKARYCLMFISSHYARKLWTKREREAAQTKAFKENREYILPLRLDDTSLPGIEDTIGYLDLRTTSYDEIIRILVRKLKPDG